MRNFVVKLRISGFAVGLEKGLSASVDLFDTPTMPFSTAHHLRLSLSSDVEAIASDVQKAQKRVFEKRIPRSSSRQSDELDFAG